MYLETDFWGSKEKYKFIELLFIENTSNSVIDKCDLTNKFCSYSFFKRVGDFVVSSKTIREEKNGKCFQFAVMFDGIISPIKWFDLVLDNCTISHDIAFDTTLISTNDMKQPLGRFPMWGKSYSTKHRCEKMKKRAYKYIANKIKEQS